ncbi:hypothetical protein BB561_003939 [Smittium simulii]|uniref:BHLH domain-containing protein n=1 Tax=Smittium simulii TaxID=133385 RepID=A0A2T9YJ31_9FUNG|nr:hypothetical protein BB561_003939 [Smittium simulii]
MTIKPISQSNNDKLTDITNNKSLDEHYLNPKIENNNNGINLPFLNTTRGLSTDAYTQKKYNEKLYGKTLSKTKSANQQSKQNQSLNFQQDYIGHNGINNIYEDITNPDTLLLMHKDNQMIQNLMQDTPSYFNNNFNCYEYSNTFLPNYTIYNSNNPITLKTQENENTQKQYQTFANNQSNDIKRKRDDDMEINSIKSLPTNIVNMNGSMSEYTAKYKNFSTNAQNYASQVYTESTNSLDSLNDDFLVFSSGVEQLNEFSNYTNSNPQYNINSQNFAQFLNGDTSLNLNTGQDNSLKFNNNGNRLPDYDSKNISLDSEILNTDISQNYNQLAMLLSGCNPNDPALNLNVGLDIDNHMGISNINVQTLDTNTLLGIDTSTIDMNLEKIKMYSGNNSTEPKINYNYFSSNCIENTKNSGIEANFKNKTYASNIINSQNQKVEKDIWSKKYNVNALGSEADTFINNSIYSMPTEDDKLGNSSIYSVPTETAKKRKGRPFSVDFNLIKLPKSLSQNQKPKPKSLSLNKDLFTDMKFDSLEFNKNLLVKEQNNSIITNSKSSCKLSDSSQSLIVQMPEIPIKASKSESRPTPALEKSSTHRVDRQLAATIQKPIVFLRPEKISLQQKKKKKPTNLNSIGPINTNLVKELQPNKNYINSANSACKNIVDSSTHENTGINKQEKSNKLDSSTEPSDEKKPKSSSEIENLDGTTGINFYLSQKQNIFENKNQLALPTDTSAKSTLKENSKMHYTENKINGKNANKLDKKLSRLEGSAKISEQRRRDAMRENFELLKRMLPVEYMTSDDGRELARPVLLARFLRWVDDTLIELEIVKSENQKLKSAATRYINNGV